MLIGKCSLSIGRQTHEFIIYAMHQRVRADNMTICYPKNQIEVSLFMHLSDIDNDLHHKVVKVVCRYTGLHVYCHVDPQLHVL